MMEKQKKSYVHYDSTQYQAIYEQGEEVLTVTTLNARRPWYSFSQSDWIKKDKASEFTGTTYNLSLDTLREQRWIGRKEYELTDHLGNVVVTVLDRKTGYGNSSGNYVGFNADVASITDYYPYGMLMSERSVLNAQSGYLFGYNGIEKVNEVAGIGNHYTALFGEYDPRTAGRWNTDPKPNPSISPYAMYAGNPILNKDPLLDTVYAVFNRGTKQLFITDMDKYVKDLPIKVVSASEYNHKGIRDKDGKQTHNQMLRLDNVFTGGKSENGLVTRDPKRPQQRAIPEGKYSILDNNADTRHVGWFRLDAQDSKPYNDTHDETGRNGFRFHLGTESWGCVTCDKSAGDRTEDWKVVSEILENTSKTTVPERRGKQRFNPFSSDLTNYGTMKVTGEDNIPQKQPTTNGQ